MRSELNPQKTVESLTSRADLDNLDSSQGRMTLSTDTAEVAAKIQASDRSSQDAHTPSSKLAIPRLINNGHTIVCSSGEYDFTKAQVPIIKVFWDNYEQRNEFMNEQVVLNSVGRGTGRFADAFKSNLVDFREVFEQHPKVSTLWRLRSDLDK